MKRIIPALAMLAAGVSATPLHDRPSLEVEESPLTRISPSVAKGKKGKGPSRLSPKSKTRARMSRDSRRASLRRR